MAAIDSISPSDRQLNLTAALLRSNQGLTKEEILATVPGYDFVRKATAASDRLFERDKADLRTAGIKLTQSLVSTDYGDRYLYKIADETFAWPEGFNPSSLQMRLLEMAAHCWQDISTTDEMDSALNRLVALGAAPDRAAIAELVPTFRPLDPTFGQLAEAIEDKAVVEFSYRKPDSGTVEVRRLSPWLFISVEGQWLIQGWDMQREQVRNFMLKRIVNKKIKTVTSDETGYRAPEAGEAAAARAELDEMKQANAVSIRVKPGTAAWSHFEMPFEPGNTKTIHYVDEELMAAVLRRFAGQLTVLSPKSIAESVEAGLKKVAAAHA